MIENENGRIKNDYAVTDANRNIYREFLYGLSQFFFEITLRIQERKDESEPINRILFEIYFILLLFYQKQ
jgi:hypothetical protein